MLLGFIVRGIEVDKVRARDAFAKESQRTARSHWRTSIHSQVHLSAFRSMRTFLKALKRSRINMGRNRKLSTPSNKHYLINAPILSPPVPGRPLLLLHYGGKEPSLHNTILMVRSYEITFFLTLRVTSSTMKRRRVSEEGRTHNFVYTSYI